MTAKNRADLLDDVATNIASNGAGAIRASNLRVPINNLVDTVFDWALLRPDVASPFDASSARVANVGNPESAGDAVNLDWFNNYGLRWSVASGGAYDAQGRRVGGLAGPTDGGDAVNKSWFDAHALVYDPVGGQYDATGRRILNLPAPVTSSEPARLAELNAQYTTLTTYVANAVSSVVAGQIGVDVRAFASMADAMANGALPNSVANFYVASFYAGGDTGGGWWRRISAPGVPKLWHQQSANGSWWQLIPAPGGFVTPQMVGAKAANDATFMDTPYVQAALDYSRTVYLPPGIYGLDAELITTLADANIIGAGKGPNGTVFAQRTNYGKVLTIGTVATGGCGRARVEGIRFTFVDSGHWLEATKTINGVTNGNPGVITSVAHGYSNGDVVYVSGVAGMTQVNGRRFKIQGVVANSFYLTDETTNANINTTAYGTYTSGGTVQRATAQMHNDTSVGIDNLITVDGWCIRMYAPTFPIIRNCSFTRGRKQIWLDAASYPLIEFNDFNGFYDSLRPGMQECVANIWIPATLGLTTKPTIRSNMMEGTGIDCADGNAKTVAHNTVIGTATVSQREDIGSQYGIYVECAEGIEVSDNIIGGHNSHGVQFNNQPFSTTYGSNVTLTGMTAANPAVFTSSAPHGFSVGQFVNFSAVTGTASDLLGVNWRVASTPTSTTFTLKAASTSATYNGTGKTLTAATIRTASLALLTGHVRVQNNFFDGDRMCSVNVASSPGTITFFDLSHNTCNGGQVCDNIFNDEGRDGGPSITQLTISNNRSQGHRKAPYALRTVTVAQFCDNTIADYNTLGDTSGDISVCSGVYIATACAGISSHDNIYGGASTDPAGANKCKWGAFFESSASGWAANERAYNLGLAGGAVCSITQTYPT